METVVDTIAEDLATTFGETIATDTATAAAKQTETAVTKTLTETTAEQVAGKSLTLLGLTIADWIQLSALAASILVVLPAVTPYLMKKLNLSNADVNNISQNLRQISDSVNKDGKLTSNVDQNQLKLYVSTIDAIQSGLKNGEIDSTSIDTTKLQQGKEIATKALTKKTGAVEVDYQQVIFVAILGSANLRTLTLQIGLFVAILLVLIWIFQFDKVNSTIVSYLITVIVFVTAGIFCNVS